MTVRVGINGFGRIGRVVARAALQRNDIEIVHINDLTDPKTLAHLLRYDSVHGTFDADIKAEGNSLQVNKKSISVSAIRDPRELPWKEKNVDIVLSALGFLQKEKPLRFI